jgi:hypothetical protein
MTPERERAKGDAMGEGEKDSSPPPDRHPDGQHAVQQEGWVKISFNDQRKKKGNLSQDVI